MAEELNDQALFEAAVSEPVQAETVEAEPPKQEQPRDESGRFAAKETQPEPAQQEQPEAPVETEKQAAQVPSWRLAEVAQERRDAIARAEAAERERYELHQQFQAMQRQLADLQKPKQEPVDFFS